MDDNKTMVMMSRTASSLSDDEFSFSPLVVDSFVSFLLRALFLLRSVEKQQRMRITLEDASPNLRSAFSKKDDLLSYVAVNETSSNHTFREEERSELLFYISGLFHLLE